MEEREAMPQPPRTKAARRRWRRAQARDARAMSGPALSRDVDVAPSAPVGPETHA